ncbi:retrovirus-related Pol polyprotein from transposon RE1 [Trichonephila clavipes]|nr:retrovirus-related Pol polyprotein from transposon RE1 [Trichonephila clavipes]
MNSVASTLNRVTHMEFNNQISVLTQNNWNTWKHEMQKLLMHYGCWQFIIQTKPEQPDEEATYKEKLDLQLRIPVYRVQQIYRWKEEDFRVVKIEAELILEANRLQLMKQDLEKAENAYLSSFTSKKSKTLPSATAAAHGDLNGKNDYQKKGDLKPITNMKMSLATEDKSCPVEGIGTLRFRVKYKGSFHEITLSDVLFNPKLRRNLLSGSILESKGAHFVGTKDGIKTLLKSSEVPHKFWGEALLCFTYAWNRICHKDSNKTPFENYSGRKPSVLHLKPFGCLTYAGVPKQIRKKFDMRAKMGIMMGYAQRTKGYRIWLIDENKLVDTINGFSDLSEQQEALMVEVTIPNCYKQAIRSRDASKWHDAMDKEINVMMERKVWDLVDHPENIKNFRKPLGFYH